MSISRGRRVCIPRSEERRVVAVIILIFLEKVTRNGIPLTNITYAHRGFVIDLVLMDMEFGKVREKLEIIEVNTTAAREHVREIERQIRLIKERIRCTMTIEVKDVVTKLMSNCSY